MVPRQSFSTIERATYDNRSIGNNNIEMEVMVFRAGDFQSLSILAWIVIPALTDDVPRWLIIDFDGLLVRLHALPPSPGELQILPNCCK